MAAEAVAPGRVHRFGATERRLHWVHAGTFTVMLGTGLVLYLPFLAQVISARPLMKAVHLVAAVAWLTALALVPLLGDRQAVRRTRRQLERFDEDDLLWLRRRGRDRTIPQGRFNAGQKAHAILQAALSVLFVVSGTLLWLGERDTALRLPGTLALHDMAMFVGGIFVAGHVYLAFAPETRPALEGAVRGTVPPGYAAIHHAKWVPQAAGPPGSPRPRPARLAAAACVVLLALAGATLLVRDVFVGSGARAPSSSPPRSAPVPAPAVASADSSSSYAGGACALRDGIHHATPLDPEARHEHR